MIFRVRDAAAGEDEALWQVPAANLRVLDFIGAFMGRRKTRDGRKSGGGRRTMRSWTRRWRWSL